MSKERSNFSYSNKLVTAITKEQSSANPYVTEKRYTAGYNNDEIVNKLSYPQALYLLFKGELPTEQQSLLLEKLMLCLMNSGPRCPATRASMVSAVSKTRPEHILPIGLITLGGEEFAQLIANAHKFIQENLLLSPQNIVTQFRDRKESGLSDTLPGFGTTYGSIDPIALRQFDSLLNLANGSEVFAWVQELVRLLYPMNIGLLEQGMVASVFLEVGLGAREAGGLYQLFKAPGILAHGMEQTHKPITSMPLLDDDDYEFNRKNAQ
jgi:citrate synthase